MTEQLRLPITFDPLIAVAKRRARRRHVLAACAAVAVGIAGLTLYLRWPSPAMRVRSSIVDAALAQNSVQWTASLSILAVGSSRSISDVTADSGMQRVTIRGGGRAGLRLVGDTVYIRGDSKGLEYVLPYTLTPAPLTPLR